jgi:hypothetical protein
MSAAKAVSFREASFERHDIRSTQMSSPARTFTQRGQIVSRS